MQAEGSQEAGAQEIASVIRKDSEEIRLTPLSRLTELFPDSDPAGLLAAAGTECPDIAVAEGASGTYYYSTKSMTGAYATQLARLEDGDTVNLIAATVRDESRMYPRPTALKTFAAPPYSVSPSAIAVALGRLGKDAGLEDIRRCTASNDAVYLYSTRYLTEAHAEGLAEYEEVGRWENP